MNISRGKRSQASALVVTIIITATIGVILCSYLALIGSRNVMTMRSMAWNGAIPVLEAGIEEALTHMTLDSNSPTANGWQSVSGQTAYWKYRPLTDDSYFYVTNVNPAATNPVIFSRGSVRSPLKNNQYISRLVRVTATRPLSLFNRAIAGNGAIKLSGGAVVDGFNSKLGFYDTSTNRSASGSIVTNSRGDSKSPAVDVGNAIVNGSIITGPGGTVTTGANGAVGDTTWTQTHTGIESGWTNDTMNVSFQSNSLPTGQTWTSPSSGTVNGTNYTYALNGGYNSLPKTIMNSGASMIVSGNASLWLTDDFTLNAGAFIYIAPGASLTMYGSTKVTISGQGVVNGTGSAANFSYVGLPGNTVLSYSGSSAFIGTINAPQTAFSISGGAAIYGAAICNTFTSSGGSSFHYDTALGGGGILTVTSWKEL